MIKKIKKIFGKKKTTKGNTVLHSYFKYASCFNEKIIDTILDANDLDINAINNEKETTFENFVYFLKRIFEKDIENLGKRYNSSKNIQITENLFFSCLQQHINKVFRKFQEKKFNFNGITKDGQELKNLSTIFAKLPWNEV